MHASVAFSAAWRAITFAFAVLFVVIGISAEWAGAADVDGKKQSGSELVRNIQRIENDAGREISKAAGAGAETVNKAAKKANGKAGK
ncbi:MAG: hypothetical protein AB1555_00980 [Nitrospirota bacterium]